MIQTFIEFVTKLIGLTLIFSSVTYADLPPLPTAMPITALLRNQSAADPIYSRSELSNVLITVALPPQANFTCVNGSAANVGVDRSSNCQSYQFSNHNTLTAETSESHQLIVIGPSNVPKNGSININFSFVLNGSSRISTTSLPFSIVNGQFSGNEYHGQWGTLPVNTWEIFTVAGDNQIYFDVAG